MRIRKFNESLEISMKDTFAKLIDLYESTDYPVYIQDDVLYIDYPLIRITKKELINRETLKEIVEYSHIYSDMLSCLYSCIEVSDYKFLMEIHPNYLTVYKEVSDTDIINIIGDEIRINEISFNQMFKSFDICIYKSNEHKIQIEFQTRDFIDIKRVNELYKSMLSLFKLCEIDNSIYLDENSETINRTIHSDTVRFSFYFDKFKVKWI